MNVTAQHTARIGLAPPAGEEAKVNTIMAPYKEMLGRAPAGLQMLGVSPPLLENYASTIHYYMEHPTLGQKLLTFIRYLVSWRGECAYCIDLNEAFLVNAGLDLDAVRSTREDASRAPLEERDKALLIFAVDAVDRPESVTTERFTEMRALGWGDREIFDAVWHAAQNRAFGIAADAFALPSDGFIA
ncbi:MAG: hypothetical protein RBS05_11810 [Zoogloea oleivorans]|jgi:alkylhydroperoxidase family enzyme|uniref:carboxymuconolactone decarboxylase family protein n=1 Tax=Zoogloea oleivorans TaxID=1552750 RepID=UPI002A35C8AF|nr:hypothetical protein [Zoogloea oleivorans]MDY0036587.1 hypothetical protein [Zoogloea oleivorans]